MSNITTPEATSLVAETGVPEVDLKPAFPAVGEGAASMKPEKAAEPEPVVSSVTRAAVSLDPSINREPVGHTFRGELFLSIPELGSVCEALEGSGFAIEEVKTPPASPRPELSFAAAVSARRRTRESTVAARSSSTVDGASEKSPTMGRSTLGKRKRVVYGGG